MDALLDWLMVVPEGFVGLLPTCASLGWDFTALGTLATYLGPIGMFTDLTTWGTVIGLMLTAEAALLGVRVALWAWRLTPFSG